MENFIFSLNATIPIFLIIILGWILMQVGIFNKEFTTVADRYVFKIALPLLVFKDIATADILSLIHIFRNARRITSASFVTSLTIKLYFVTGIVIPKISIS